MTKLQQSRIEAIDLARGVSIFMVILVHTLWMNGTIPTQEGWLGDVIHFIGKGTGMFLMTMGVSFMISRNNSLLLSFKRAVLLLLAAYLMNFLKFVLPHLLSVMPASFVRAYGWEEPLNTGHYIYLITTGDILQLAGFCLFFMGLLRHFTRNKYIYLAVAALLIISCRFLQGIQTGNPIADYFLELLWGSSWHVYFAVFPWFAFILVGMFFGAWYTEEGRSIRVFSAMGPAGIACFLIGGVLCYFDFAYHFGDFFHLGPGGALYLIGFNLLLIRTAFFVAKRFPANGLFRALVYMSKRVTSLYFIQWVLICWGMALLGYQEYGSAGVLLLIIIYVLLTFGVQLAVDRLTSKPTKHLQYGNN